MTSPPGRTDREGFTLIELMVVVGIIILIAGVSVPAISAFLKGKRLDQAGRMIQSAFSEARRMTVTSRIPHRIIFYSRDDQELQERLYGVKVYKRGSGYIDAEFELPSTLSYELNFTTPGGSGNPADPDPLPYTQNQDQLIAIVEGLPNALEYRPDGSLAIIGGGWADIEDGPAGRLDPSNEDHSAVRADYRADIVVTQRGANKRCFIDILPNTGRVELKVLPVESGG